MVAVLQTDELPRDVSGAEALLLSHLEHKAEIDARQTNFTAFEKQGQALVEAEHYASKEVSSYFTFTLWLCCMPTSAV